MDRLNCIEIQTQAQPEFAVIWLHGLGADGNDFVPIVAELNLPAELGIRFIFPHAPKRAITINNGMVMRAWYDINSLDFSNRADESGVRESAAQVEALIAHQINQGIASERIFLAGFSQGGAIALFTGLRYSQQLAGILALSTYLPLATQITEELPTNQQRPPIFYAHGRFDNVIALQYAQQSHQRLQSWNYSVEWHEYPMAHSVCAEEIQALSHWLQQHCQHD